MALPTLTVDFGLQDGKRTRFCCSKPPSLWCFVMAARGHQHATFLRQRTQRRLLPPAALVLCVRAALMTGDRAGESGRGSSQPSSTLLDT